MKRIASFLVLFVGAFGLSSFAQSPAVARVDAVAGVWQGTATVRGGQVPVTVRISGTGSNLKVAFLNGPAEHSDESPASRASFDGTHLVASYDYFARKLDVTLADGKMTGSYGGNKGASTALALTHVARLADPAATPNPPNIQGSWEIVTRSAKG